MENTCQEQDSKALSIEEFEIAGEPAIIINGVPDVPPTDGTIVLSNTKTDTNLPETIGCGEWLEGREVRKLFMGQYYSGMVTKFDKATRWYRVEYEDGDSEDLDWHELEEVLLPIDITIPLKSLALMIVKNRQRWSQNFGGTRTGKNKNLGTKGKEIDLHEEAGKGS